MNRQSLSLGPVLEAQPDSQLLDSNNVSHRTQRPKSKKNKLTHRLVPFSTLSCLSTSIPPRRGARERTGFLCAACPSLNGRRTRQTPRRKTQRVQERCETKSGLHVKSLLLDDVAQPERTKKKYAVVVWKEMSKASIGHKWRQCTPEAHLASRRRCEIDGCQTRQPMATTVKLPKVLR